MSRVTALDFAARVGRLDIAQLLLNAGGISARPGESGYDGALNDAERRGFWTIADVIRSHSQFLRRVQDGDVPLLG